MWELRFFSPILRQLYEINQWLPISTGINSKDDKYEIKIWPITITMLGKQSENVP